MAQASVPPQVALTALLEAYLAFVFQRDPIEATQLGIHDEDDRLSDYGAMAFAADLDRRKQFLHQLDAIDPVGLPPDARMDWEVARIDLTTSIRRLEERPIWESAPYWVLEQLGIALSALMRDDGQDPAQQGERLLARLNLAPGYLATAQETLTSATAPLHVEMGLTSLKGLRQFVASAVPGFADQVDEALQRELKQATTVVLSALDEFESFLTEFQGRALGSFACGPDFFDFLLQRFHLLSLDHRQLADFGLERMAEDKAALEAYARELDPDRTWMEQIEAIKDNHPQGDDFLKAYHDEMVRARAHCVAEDLITLPEGEEADVQWLPEYRRAGAPLGLMFTTPPFAAGLSSSLVITPLDPEASPDRQRQHMRDNCYAFARSITLHEIYPGHHTQKVHHKLATANSPMRRYFSSPVMVEGWGLYTEDLMEETGFMTEPAVRLFKLRNALWRSARVVVDSGLHTRGMSFEQAVDLMVNEVRLDRRMAEGEVRRYTTHDNPTYPSAYLLGKTAIHSLREQWRAKQRDAHTLKGFHDTLLSFGSPPVRLIAERMVGDAA